MTNTELENTTREAACQLVSDTMQSDQASHSEKCAALRWAVSTIEATRPSVKIYEHRRSTDLDLGESE